jgi:hypothetical protein
VNTWKRLDWLILLLLAVLVALFFWRILTPNPADRQSFPPGDFYLQFWAFTTFDARQLGAGQLPLWSPYTFAGSPFWADVQAAVFYPFSLLTLILSAPWGFSAFALEVEAIFHFWLAAVFMYLLGRCLTHSRPAALIAALTFTFSGYLTGYPSQQLAVLEADVWLPLILFFLYRANQRMADSEWRIANSGSRLALSPLLLAGLAFGLTLMAGHPQSGFIVACLSLAFLIFDFGFTTTVPEVKRSGIYDLRSSILLPLSSIALFLLTGLGLAAIQFIPAVEYTLRSVRAEGTYDKMSGGFPLIDLIQFLLPGQVSHYSPLYVGVVGLILAVWVVFAAPNRHTTFWAVLAVIALLISLGGHTFFYSPLYLSVPGFSIFRGQERWAFAVAFSLSVLAGYGFKALLTADTPSGSTGPLPPTANLPISNLESRISNLQRLTLYLLLFALLLTFLFFVGLNQTGWTSASPFYNLLGGASLLTILLALTWLLWRFGPRQRPALFAGLTAALICFDLFSANWQTNLYPQPPEWHTQMPPAVAAIKADAAQSPGEPFRVYNEFRVYDNYGVPFEIEDLWGASPLRLARYDEFLAPPMPIERTWELLNVKYVITWRKELYLPSIIIYAKPTATDTTYVHRLNQVGPVAWLVHQAQIADDEAILQKIADPTFDRWHIALLEPGSQAYLDEALMRSGPEVVSEGTVEHYNVERYNAQRYNVITPTPALLMLSEVHDPSWQATVDGQPVPILRADYTLRAVPVPPGEHTIELAFRPFSFTLGAIISGATLIWVVITFVSTTPRRPKKTTPN